MLLYYIYKSVVGVSVIAVNANTSYFYYGSSISELVNFFYLCGFLTD